MTELGQAGLRLQSLLVRGFGAPAVRDRVGLVAASEIWGGSVPRDHPGWYVWLAEREGVYRLDVENAQVMREGAGLLLGRISVRYYPSPSEPELVTFSAEERDIVAGDWLDLTGAPRIERADSIPDWFFSVGAIECLFDSDGHAVAVAMAALDRFRTTVGGERVRDVPGWDLTRPAFTAVAGLAAQLGQRSATRLVVTRQRGFATVDRGDGYQLEECDEVVQGEALLLLGGASAAAGDRDLRVDLVDPEAELLLDAPLSNLPSGERELGSDTRLRLPVEGAWFVTEPLHERGVCCSC